MSTGVYIHIPFCEQRCYYCAFTVAVTPEGTYKPYVQRLLREIELSNLSVPVETIFFGGGTLSDAKLERYLRAGVNRISLGVQSFDDEDLKHAGRLHSAADVFRDIDALRKHGFDNVGIDLIAGFPHQRSEVWRANLDCVERLLPEHVSIYMLDLEERSAWKNSG